jgi:hypothetical protein
MEVGLVNYEAFATLMQTHNELMNAVAENLEKMKKIIITPEVKLSELPNEQE